MALVRRFLQQVESGFGIHLLCFLLTQVVASQPYAGEGRGAAVLRLLNVLHLSIHKSLEQLWNERIPVLVELLEGKGKRSLSGRSSLGGDTRLALEGLWFPGKESDTLSS